jgi:hypothetical protein
MGLPFGSPLALGCVCLGLSLHDWLASVERLAPAFADEVRGAEELDGKRK